MNPQPKVKPERSPKYLAFIRSQPCCICGWLPMTSYGYLMHAHHTETGGMGTKGSDFSAVPLCFACHRKVHDQYGKKGPWSIDDLKAIQAEYRGKIKELL